MVMAAMLGRVRAAALAETGNREQAIEELNQALEIATQQGLIYERALILKDCSILAAEDKVMKAEAEALFERLGIND